MTESAQPNLTSFGSEPLRLHIGGTEPKPGWKILNIKPGPGVDFVGNCADLSAFADNSVAEVYASHVFEHLDFTGSLATALREVRRVLQSGGILRLGVPDMETLCWLFLRPNVSLADRFHLMQMMFGGHTDEFDYHHVGLTWELLVHYLNEAGFTRVRRVADFGLFNDTTSLRFANLPISLNVEAVK